MYIRITIIVIKQCGNMENKTTFKIEKQYEIVYIYIYIHIYIYSVNKKYTFNSKKTQKSNACIETIYE